MIFSNTDKEITLIYNSDRTVGKKILAYAKTEELPIHEIDIKHVNLHGSHWAEIAGRMGVAVKDLVNTESADFLQKFKDTSDLDDNDWLKLLQHNPTILRAPIVMKGDKVVMMNNPQDMLHFL